MAVRREHVRSLSARPAGRSSMDRVRRAGTLPLFLLIAVMAVATVSAPPAELGGRGAGGRLGAAVAWPPSTLLVSASVTGGASASAAFAELTSAGSAAGDLARLATASLTPTC